jgi:hypothetical protein
MALTSHFEDDVEVTSIRKITEFSSDNCPSMTGNALSRSYHKSLPDISNTEQNNIITFEENAIFEHESSLYGGDVFSESDIVRHSSDSGTVDDDELTVGSPGTAVNWNDTNSSLSSSNLTTSSGDNSNPEVIYKIRQ